MSWEDLNKRQQQYLKAIYEIDQETERQERSMWNRGGRPRPAIEWRWLYYGIIPETGTDSPLRRRLLTRKLVDQSTGSTFEALASRKYILLQYKPVVGGELFTYVQITPAGRRLVRAATGQQSARAFPTGTLRQWHWKALALAWRSRPAGVKNEHSSYGRISWNTWLRLRDYKRQDKVCPLVEEYTTPSHFNQATGVSHKNYWLRLSSAGEQYYRENWQRYHDLYPDVEAPDPAQENSVSS